MFVTDVWSDVRELTSGYFAGDEAIREKDGTRVHKQQTPIALLLRIILTSSLPNDTVFDPMAGTGTTLVTAMQLYRNAIGIEIDPKYVELIKVRLKTLKPSDDIYQFLKDYEFTPNLEEISGVPINFAQQTRF
jgi:DNA modification methylase